MKNTPTNNNQERSIELSLAPKEYSGKATHYVPTEVSVSSLEETLKSHNYSPVHWTGNYRLAKNFKKAVGFCIDIDGTMKIAEAESILQQNNLNYALVTTRSHRDESHRFRVLVPFNTPLYVYDAYVKAAKQLAKLFNGACDEAVFDGARQFYGSPDDAYYSSNWTGQDYDVSEYLGEDLSDIIYGRGDWNDSLVVRTKDVKEISITKILIDENKKKTTAIFCPWHDDGAHSAFVSYSDKSGNWFIHCEPCKKNYWKTKILPSKEERCKGYWSQGTGFYETGLVGDEFFFEQIGEKKLYCRINAMEKQDQGDVFRWLVKNQHIPTLRRIDHYGDPNIEESVYSVKKEEGVVEVRHAAIPVCIEDNKFVDDYLNATFKENTDFIKQWLAAYCYTNHRPLPTLVLVGARGSGKNTFAEAVGMIYESLSTPWEVSKDQFNPAYEKKLLIADETLTNEKKNYTELKKITGQSHHVVNKKNTPHYQVMNNMNVIILSNRLLPIFVESSEMPLSPEMNQFFVYEFSKPGGPVDAELPMKLKRCLGHYVRSELRTVFSMMNCQKYRYALPVPITDEERRLFGSSVSEDDDLSDRLIEMVVEKLQGYPTWDYREHILAGMLPKEVFGEFTFPDKDKRVVIRRMRELGYLSGNEPRRFQGGGKRSYCYEMLDPMKKRIERDLGSVCFQ